MCTQGPKKKGRKEENSLFLHPDSPENNNVLVFQIQVAIEDCNDFSLKSSAGKPLQSCRLPLCRHSVSLHMGVMETDKGDFEAGRGEAGDDALSQKAWLQLFQ